MNKRKIVEIEDDSDELNSEMLDNELRDELNDLSSNVTTALNTPIMTPKTSSIQNMSSLDLCENGICKLNFNDNDQDVSKDSVENKENDIIQKTEINNTEKVQMTDQSSPLRYISQEPKRGRPKKNN